MLSSVAHIYARTAASLSSATIGFACVNDAGVRSSTC